MSELTGSNNRCRAQFKCAQTVVGQRSAGNGPNGLSYDYYYYNWTTASKNLAPPAIIHVAHTDDLGLYITSNQQGQVFVQNLDRIVSKPNIASGKILYCKTDWIPIDLMF